jgi:hypothetical protein
MNEFCQSAISVLITFAAGKSLFQSAKVITSKAGKWSATAPISEDESA